MRKIVAWIVIATIIIIVIPLLIISCFGSKNTPNGESSNISGKVKVFHADTQKVEEEDFEHYVSCVVAAEMPASFETEALKAQAVAARTYTLRKIKENAGDETDSHRGGDICTDSKHCQAYITEKKAKSNWGENAKDNWAKIKEAVSSTKNLIMVYQDEPILAVFHSSSSGITESSKDVWGGDLPYLSSVQSDGEELCPNHTSNVSISIDGFKEKLRNYSTDIILDDDKLVGDIVRSNAGGITSISIGDKLFKGSEIRTLFGLRSSNFNINVIEDIVYFDVIGNGHGVGLSQYGANYMASSGKSYEDILNTYYSGVQIVKMN